MSNIAEHQIGKGIASIEAEKCTILPHIFGALRRNAVYLQSTCGKTCMGKIALHRILLILTTVSKLQK